MFLGLKDKKISHSATVYDLYKELVRKLIHLCAAFVPFFSFYFFNATVIFLVSVTLCYVFFEFMRMKGINIPIISCITRLASRKRDEGHFVFGPVTLSVGVVFSLLLFPYNVATIGIFALAFGDGFASLIGKIYGKMQLSKLSKKTVAGSVACFCGVFFSLLFIMDSILHASIVAMFATCVELVPLKDLDNVLIPIATGVFVIIFNLA